MTPVPVTPAFANFIADMRAAGIFADDMLEELEDEHRRMLRDDSYGVRQLTKAVAWIYQRPDRTVVEKLEAVSKMIRFIREAPTRHGVMSMKEVTGW